MRPIAKAPPRVRMPKPLSPAPSRFMPELCAAPSVCTFGPIAGEDPVLLEAVPGGGAICVEPPVEVADVAAGLELLEVSDVEDALLEVVEAALDVAVDVETAELEVDELADVLDGGVDVEALLVELELLVEVAGAEVRVDVLEEVGGDVGAVDVDADDDVVLLGALEVEVDVAVEDGELVGLVLGDVLVVVGALAVLLGALVVVLGATTLMLANAPLCPAARVHPTWAM